MLRTFEVMLGTVLGKCLVGVCSWDSETLTPYPYPLTVCKTTFSSILQSYSRTRRQKSQPFPRLAFSQLSIRIITTRCYRSDHILVLSLWCYRSGGVITLVTFKALYDVAPSYIMELIRPYKPGRTLRSSSQSTCCTQI